MTVGSWMRFVYRRIFFIYVLAFEFGRQHYNPVLRAVAEIFTWQATPLLPLIQAVPCVILHYLKALVQVLSVCLTVFLWVSPRFVYMCHSLDIWSILAWVASMPESCVHKPRHVLKWHYNSNTIIATNMLSHSIITKLISLVACGKRTHYVVSIMFTTDTTLWRYITS
jgi:hypothetical protein